MMKFRQPMRMGGEVFSKAVPFTTGAFEVLGQTYLVYESSGEALAWGFPLQARQAVTGGFLQRMQQANWY